MATNASQDKYDRILGNIFNRCPHYSTKANSFICILSNRIESSFSNALLSNVNEQFERLRRTFRGPAYTATNDGRHVVTCVFARNRCMAALRREKICQTRYSHDGRAARSPALAYRYHDRGSVRRHIHLEQRFPNIFKLGAFF